jgi:hypothetical protein
VYIPVLTDLYKTAATNPSPLFLTIAVIVAAVSGMFAYGINGSSIRGRGVIGFVLGIVCLLSAGIVGVALLTLFHVRLG